MDQETALLLRHNFSKIYLIFGGDALLLPVIMFTAAESPGLITGISVAVHCLLIVWIGLTLRWIGQATGMDIRNKMIFFWASFVLSFFSMGIFILFLWITAALIIKQARQGCLAATLPADREEPPGQDLRNNAPDDHRTIPGSIWPLFVLLLLVVASMAQVILALAADLREFGALGIFFVLLLSTPFFLLVPALLRIPAATEARRSMVVAQYMTYFMVIVSWMVFFLRQM